MAATNDRETFLFAIGFRDAFHMVPTNGQEPSGLGDWLPLLVQNVSPSWTGEHLCRRPTVALGCEHKVQSETAVALL
eukprot:707187-Amphidinium_carterae.1